MKDDMAGYSKYDLDFAIVVFRVGTHIDKEEEDRSDHFGTYHGIKATR